MHMLVPLDTQAGMQQAHKQAPNRHTQQAHKTASIASETPTHLLISSKQEGNALRSCQGQVGNIGTE